MTLNPNLTLLVSEYPYPSFEDKLSLGSTILDEYFQSFKIILTGSEKLAGALVCLIT